MTPEEFRRHAHAMVDWMADYLETVEQHPVRAQVKPGEIAARLAEAPPEAGEPMERIFEEFRRDVLPGVTHWQHPRFFAYFPANASPPSVLAEMLTATLAAQGMLWQTNPAGTEMEIRVLDWLRQMLGLPDGLAGVIQSTASEATLAAILTAREKATGWGANADGLRAHPPLAVYASAQAHSSIEKDVRIAGLGDAQFRKIPVDGAYRMRPDALAEAIEADQAAGVRPACVVASLGGTGVGAVDPLRPIGEICRRHDVFLHVDAAWAGSALVCPEHRWMIDGVELADSFVFNPHKWLLTNFDCTAHFVRDPDALVRTFSILPEYLKTAAAGDVTDFRDWGIPLGRRFRALKLWFVIRSYGVDGLRELIRRHCALAGDFAGWVEAAPDFEVVAPPVLALVNFRWHPPGVDDPAELDRLNAALIARINDDGRIYLTQNRVDDRFVLRLSVGQTTTDRRHVEEAWSVIREVAAGILP